jgi:lipid-binding SYLF domain-containing protein
MKFKTIYLLLGVFTITAARADEAKDFEGLLGEATKHLEGFSSHSQAEAITNIAGAAKAVIIIPDEKAAAFIVGYKRGTGAMYRRHGDEWSDPIFLTFSKYGIGVQAGGSHNEVIVMVLTQSIADGLIEGVSNLGGSGGFALGSLGMGSTGDGSVGGGLEMFSVSTRKGIELGGSIENTNISPAEEFNVAAWGEDYDMKSILSQPGGDLDAAQELREALIKATKTSFEQ